VTALEELRRLRLVLTRLGARAASRYWGSATRVFSTNLIAGIVVGALASIAGAVLVAIDAHRGADSYLYRALDELQTVVTTIQAQMDREL
jgi:hypothetical protein